jgi:nucleotide sugar dehydrogenase
MVGLRLFTEFGAEKSAVPGFLGGTMDERIVSPALIRRHEREQGRAVVCIQGLGFVGAANAIAIASARGPDGLPLYDVIGVDLPNELGRERAALLNQGLFPFTTTDDTLVEAARSVKIAGNLVAETHPGAFSRADIIAVDVGLDVEEKGETPRFCRPPFEAAIASVGDHMRPDALVLLESTVPPGTCEKIVAPLLKQRLQARSLPADDLKLAYCYERVTPGDEYLASIVDMWRVYAGLTPAAADAAERFLSSIIDVKKRPLKRLSNLRAAEMAKVVENTYRAVNIALIDEWERFARCIDVDLFEVLEAIRVRPTHQNIRYPGLGVGGYCLSKDPMFGPASARELYGLTDLSFPLSTASVKINDAMPSSTVNLLEQMLTDGLQNKNILILGASYREDVDDTRHSPSIILAKRLLTKGATVELADPLVKGLEDLAIPMHTELPSPNGFDAVVLAVGHKQYRALDVAEWAGQERPVVLDSSGVLGRPALEALSNAGFKVAAIGRGVV